MSAGQPPLFSNPEDLEKAVLSYFEYIKGETKEIEITDNEEKLRRAKASGYTSFTVETKMEVVREPEPPTITGLALYLGFASRQSLYDYEKRGEYSYIIKNARLRVEKGYELRLHGNNPTGSIFALKNMGWYDKQEIDQKTTIEDKRLDLSKLTDEELRTLAEIQRKSGIGEEEV